MIDRPGESVVTEFLRVALADDALGVPKLEAMARAARLLGERQSITHSKVFKKAKTSLGIKSVRNGFGDEGGWLWRLERQPDPPAREPPVPVEDTYAEAICDRLVDGESLRRICSDAGMPGRATVFRWLARHKEFRDWYISARDFQAEGLGEEMFEILRDTSGDDLARARLRALERQAARMDAEKIRQPALKENDLGPTHPPQRVGARRNGTSDNHRHLPADEIGSQSGSRSYSPSSQWYSIVTFWPSM